MSSRISEENLIFIPDEAEGLGGTNFLVSAIHLLRKQRRDLQAENEQLKAKLQILERQNAVFLDISADRLLQKQG
ncbi:MAG: hypothetical protein EA369_04700 [Bradymonadales bacterium]|nr:MAG: hypothetical protein EA369_04700 [Bradymonadales bacterium]